jgi:hypothetical protein
MDPDGSKQIKKTERKTKEESIFKRYLINISDVLPTFWVRRIIQTDNGFKWFILDSRYNFLLHFRIFLVIVYILYAIIK